jgi:DNA-binding IclR family transcriptional regulator
VDLNGRLRAAISVAAPAYRCDLERLTGFLPLINQAVGTIRTLLPVS